jgi:hypothetical protein
MAKDVKLFRTGSNADGIDTRLQGELATMSTVDELLQNSGFQSQGALLATLKTWKKRDSDDKGVYVFENEPVVLYIKGDESRLVLRSEIEKFDGYNSAPQIEVYRTEK